MRYFVLATDYDGTLARLGHVEEPVWTAIRRLRDSGRKPVLVTGRELEDLQAICPHLDLFDRVVAENGALVYHPRTKEVRTLAESPPPDFAARLKSLKVTPLSAGHVIVATVKPHETAVLKTINEMGLELQVIFNQESVMILPSGVNKATGLSAALKELGYSPHNTVAIGDAENDHALLSACECGVAVGNGVPALKERADIVTKGSEGTAVIELINGLLADDLESISPRLSRHDILLGITPEGREERLPAYGRNLLIAGTSGSGKSTLMSSILERLAEARYQYALIDPEGRYPELSGSVVIGSARQPPIPEEVLTLLASGRHAVANLARVSLADRPAFFDRLFPRLLELRGRMGRPHWIVIDEAHHLMPPAWPADKLPARLGGIALVTVHPGSVAPAMLRTVDLALAVGQDPAKTLADFFDAGRVEGSAPPAATLAPGTVLAFGVRDRRGAFKLTLVPSRSDQARRRQTYVDGRLPDDRVFVFRGPNAQLSLRAYNLTTFLELASGVDDATWLYHLKRNEYSKWFREAVKDDDLARDTETVESEFANDASASREAIRKAVEQRYKLLRPPPVAAED